MWKEVAHNLFEMFCGVVVWEIGKWLARWRHHNHGR